MAGPEERYRPKTFEAKLGYLVEECGELIAAVGKTIRWGLNSVNPELSEDDQETNCAWMLREMDDVEVAIIFMRAELGEEQVPDHFVEYWNVIAHQLHETAKAKGWWPEGRNDGENIALIHSELSEALEGMRSGNPDSEAIPGFSVVEEELADAVIRLMDMAAARKWRVAEAIKAKSGFNKGRGHRHGRKF